MHILCAWKIRTDVAWFPLSFNEPNDYPTLKLVPWTCFKTCTHSLSNHLYTLFVHLSLFILIRQSVFFIFIFIWRYIILHNLVGEKKYKIKIRDRCLGSQRYILYRYIPSLGIFSLKLGEQRWKSCNTECFALFFGCQQILSRFKIKWN